MLNAKPSTWQFKVKEIRLKYWATRYKKIMQQLPKTNNSGIHAHSVPEEISLAGGLGNAQKAGRSQNVLNSELEGRGPIIEQYKIFITSLPKAARE